MPKKTNTETTSEEMKEAPVVETTQAETIPMDTVQNVQEEENAPEENPVMDENAEDTQDGDAPNDDIKEMTYSGATSKRRMMLAKLKEPRNLLALMLGVAIIVVFLIIWCSGPTKVFEQVDSGTVTYMNAGTSIVSSKGDVVKFDDDYRTCTSSGDASVMTVWTTDDDLYLINKDEKTKIDSDIAHVVVSYYGDTVAYTVDEDDYSATLYLYDVKSGKKAKIAENVYAQHIVLSPDGMTVAYIGNFDANREEYSYQNTGFSGDLCVSVNKQEGKEVFANSFPIAISNRGKYVYYTKNNERLYVNDERIANTVPEAVWLNSEHTEILYIEDGSTYVYQGGSDDSVRISKHEFAGVCIPEDIMRLVEPVMYSYWPTDVEYVCTVGVYTFDEKVFQFMDYDNYEQRYDYIYKNFEESEKICTGVIDVQVTEDGKCLYFLDNGDLVCVENLHKSRESETILDDSELVDLAISNNGKRIYAINGDGELFYLKKNKLVKIANDIVSQAYSEKYDMVFFITEDDELCSAGTTAKSKKKVIGEFASSVSCTYSGFVYFLHNEDHEPSSNDICIIKTKKSILRMNED